MTLISTVHVGEPDQAGKFQPMDNAFWDGAQMAYGDGDGVVFQRFTRSLDVVAHELTHGVQSFTSNLVYRGQSGALNEHFSDVFGILVRQWKLGEKADKASWLIGADVLVPAKTRRAIRDMENPGTAYVDDPDLGTDPQPAHMKDFYSGAADNGGVQKWLRTWRALPQGTNNLKRTAQHSLQLECESGTGTNKPPPMAPRGSLPVPALPVPVCCAISEAGGRSTNAQTRQPTTQ
jgi:hypothetical protein